MRAEAPLAIVTTHQRKSTCRGGGTHPAPGGGGTRAGAIAAFRASWASSATSSAPRPCAPPCGGTACRLLRFGDERRWGEFITCHKEQLLVCDFFTVETLSLKTLHVLFF